MSGIPPRKDSDWLRLTLREMERRLSRLESSRRAESTTIGDGGLVIRGSGGIRLISADGVDQFAVYGEPDALTPDGDPQPTILMSRADGSPALTLFDPLPEQDGYRQIFRLFDAEGHEIFAEDANTGFGIATPYLPAALYPSRFSDWVGNGSTAYETLLWGYQRAWNPWLHVAVRASMDTSGATGRVRLLLDGVNQGARTDVGFGIGTHEWVAAMHDSPEVGLLRFVEIQARRDSGSGQIRVGPLLMEGQQT